MQPLDLVGPSAGAALRALYTLAMADGELDPRERRLIELHAELSGQTSEGLAVISAPELAAQVVDADARRSIVQRMVMMALLDEVAHENEIATLRTFARALDVDEPAIEQIEAFMKGHVACLGFDLVRRGFLGATMRKAWEERGLRAILSLAGAARGAPDEVIAARYRALGDLPEGTVGRAYFDHLRSNGYPLPGERDGAPELLGFHDLGHVLSGYSTDPRGEVQMAGFEAGYMRTDGFSVVMLALFIFHAGVQLPRVHPSHGEFDVDAFHAAYERGRTLRVDLREWDRQRGFLMTIEAARSELGLV